MYDYGNEDKAMRLTLLATLYFVTSCSIAVCQENNTAVTDSSKNDFSYVSSLMDGNVFEYTRLSNMLLIYDRVAWISTDSLMTEPMEVLSKIGAEWFCYQKGKTWYAVYGKYENNRYNPVLHYFLDTMNYSIKKINNIEYDTLLFTSYARSINKSRIEMFIDSAKSYISYNHYVFQDSLNHINVIILPAFQRDSKAVFGSEYWYIFNSNGDRIIEKKVYNGKLKYYLPDKTKSITLDFTELETPPFCAIFYVLYYKNYFKEIIIDTKNMIHQFMDGFFISIVKDRGKE